MNHIYHNFCHLLTDFNLPFLQPRELDIYCEVIHAKGAALRNCFGFVDGTVRPISRPGKGQRVVYNGHKKVHSLKFQKHCNTKWLNCQHVWPCRGGNGTTAKCCICPIFHQNCHNMLWIFKVNPSVTQLTHYAYICKVNPSVFTVTQLTHYRVHLQGQPFCIYGDPAYPLRVHLQGQPFCIYGDPAYPLRVHLQGQPFCIYGDPSLPTTRTFARSTLLYLR